MHTTNMIAVASSLSSSTLNFITPFLRVRGHPSLSYLDSSQCVSQHFSIGVFCKTVIAQHVW
jgi:hypothetical protein